VIFEKKKAEKGSDFSKIRLKMVEEQLVARGIHDPKVIAAMRKVPRHFFVEEALQNQAYNDRPLPIGEKQTISQPYMVALMTEALQLKGMEKVLEIGAGSGYQTAILAEIARLPARGMTSLKVFTAYNQRLRLQDGEIFRVLRAAGEHGLLTMVHAENGDVIEVLVAEALAAGNRAPVWHARTRPAWGAIEATLRGIALAAQAGAPLYVVHVNTAGEVDQIRYARERGLPVMGETCPPYLFFTEDDLARPDGAKWICSPPMRTAADNQGLWAGLTAGDLQTVGTDHCPFFYDGTRPIVYEGQPVQIPGKELGRDDFTKIPNGVPGVGDRLPVLWTHGVRTGRLTQEQFVALTSTTPAKAFGLYPRKGALLPGSDADLVVWDPQAQVKYGVGVAQHRTDYNLYEGWDLVGFPEQVYQRGSLLVDRGQWLGRAGGGQFLERAPGFTLV